MIAPPQDELKKLAALHDFMAPADQRAARTRQWLRERRIVSQLSFCEDAVAFFFLPEPTSVRPGTNAESLPAALLESGANGAVSTPETGGEEAGLSVGPNGQSQRAIGNSSLENGATYGVRAAVHVEQIEFGRKWIAGEPGEPLSLQVDVLTKHVVVLAGAGSGKTVLVRRLVEEAALAGIPSIVIDGANDLTRLGDHWPETPPDFDAKDRAKMERYQRETEVVVWSPGRERGNPLRFEPLPDFAAVRGDADELHAAIDMARSSMDSIVMGTKVDKVRQGSPAAIDTVREQLSQRGAGGGDVAKLSRGLFYVFSDGFSALVKVKFPLCLSHHPASPPDEAEVLARAARSRALTQLGA